MSWSIFPPRTHRRVREMFIFMAIFSLAHSLVLIFEPIFFYTEGIPLWRIALYYALHYGLYVFLLPVGAKVAIRFGLEQSLAISTPLFVIYFLVLAVMPQWPGLFWLAWVLLTIHKIFYWPAFHVTFARFTAGGERGQEVAWIFLVSYGVGVMGPLVGGVVAALFGFPVLFAAAAAVALLSSAALLRTRERYRAASLAYRKPWQTIFDRQHRGTMVAMLGSGANLIHMLFWPVYLFMIVSNTALLGTIATVSTLISSLVGLAVGGSADRMGQRKMMRWQLPLASMSFLLRPLVATVPVGAVADAWGRTSDVGVLIPLYSRIYAQSRQRPALSFVVATEMVLSAVKSATALVLVGLFLVLAPYPAFVLTFVLAAGLVWLHWWL